MGSTSEIPAPEIKRGKLVRASDKKSADWWRAVEAINRPHQFEAGDYRCKVCGTPWRCHPDGTWSIRTSRLAERCCDNHPGFLLVMEPDPSLPPPTPQPTDRSEAPSSEVSDLVLRIDAILGAEPGVLWARVVRPLLRDLRDELASAAASGSGAEEGQLIAERDELEEFVAACAAAAGCEREWSNLHDHRECVMEACRAFRAYVGAGKMESK